MDGPAAPVVGSDGSLPTVGVLPTPDGTLVLVDPVSSRIVLHPRAEADVGRDGELTLRATESGGCVLTAFETLDRTRTTTTPQACASVMDPARRVDLTSTASPVWWWPFGEGKPALEVDAGFTLRAARHTGRVVSRDPVEPLRVDEDGVTVLVGDLVRRYAWVSGG